jgi:AraC-like DNA-binding protein
MIACVFAPETVFKNEVYMHAISHPASLASLYRRRVFHSTTKVDCHNQVAKELSEHDLFWKGDDVDTELFKASIHQLQIFMLKYGAELVIKPKPFDGFLLVHMTLSGTAEIESDGERICIPAGRSAVVAPKRTIRMWWQSGSEQLILKVPISLFHDIGLDDEFSLHSIPSLYLLPDNMTSHWEILMQSLLQSLDLSVNDNKHTAWIDYYERGAAQFLWSHLSSVAMTHTPPATRLAQEYGDSLCGTGNATRLDMLEKYIQARLCAPVSLSDLATATGVSVRSLNTLCHQHYGAAPMDVLRNIRLDAAREQLQTSDNNNITDVAFAFGFAHLGRFSAYYKNRFGELPKQTRGRAVAR